MNAPEDFFADLESAAAGARRDLRRTIAALRFDRRGLLPVTAQCARSGRVLMQAWMNRDALDRTLACGRMTYFSRRKNALWQKGETSGNVQELVSLSADCDGDSLLAVVRQTGPACHTNRPSCFYVRLFPDGAQISDNESARPPAGK
ncbi:MAG: phosphoribosyl-AMP cyclohydrolase [Gammaproteobacteria bacterium]